MIKIAGKKRLAILLVSLLLIIAAGVGATLAYVFAQTGEVENTFTPSKVSCAVQNDIGVIGNTGNTEAYIRVKIVVNWMKPDGTVWAKAPVNGIDYIMNYSDTFNTDWHYSGVDDFYYYYAPIAVGESTAQLIKSCNSVAGKNPEGYELSVEFLASAIQSTPKNVVGEQWSNSQVKVGVDAFDKLTFTAVNQGG